MPVNPYSTQIRDTTQGIAGQNMGTTRDSPLGDVGMYLTSNPFRSWKLGDGGFDEAGFMSYNQFNGVPLYRKNEQGQWEINPEGRLGELNKKVPGLDFRLENDPYVEDYDNGRPSFQLKWNPQALPQDKFGNYGTSVNPDFARNGLYNPQAVYTDPNYGKITPQQNIKPDSGFLQTLSGYITRTPLLVGLAAAGLGSALGAAGLSGGAGMLTPGRILSGLQGAAGLSRGDPSSLLSFLPFASNVPGLGQLGQIMRYLKPVQQAYFLANIMRNRGRR